MSTADEYPPRTTNPIPTVVAHMMTPGVVQIPGDVSVSEAALMLEREQTPCLLVKDTETLFGLMTPTDIVKKVVAQGLEPHNIEARTIMTQPVQFIEYDRALEEATALMTSTGASHLIVTKDNQPVGVLSARDLMLTPPPRRTRIPAMLRISQSGIAAGTTPYSATIIQLGHLGALLELNTALDAGTNILLVFSLPGQHTPLTLQGTVLVCKENRSGNASNAVDIQFKNVATTDQTRIKAWVLQTLPLPQDRS
ncbi:MAG TPA: CBS domain-containing protein [Nitrospiraceae bacterium]|nr:CBS domain-containing protein [Nitrospiraceae bacterium]